MPEEGFLQFYTLNPSYVPGSSVPSQEGTNLMYQAYFTIDSFSVSNSGQQQSNIPESSSLFLFPTFVGALFARMRKATIPASKSSPR